MIYTKHPPLPSFTNALFRDIRNASFLACDFRFYTATDATRIELMSVLKPFVDKLSDQVAACQKWADDPCGDSAASVLMSELEELDDEFCHLGDEDYLEEDKVDVRDILDTNTMIEVTTVLTNILAVCELHKCSALFVIAQNIAVKCTYVIYLILKAFKSEGELDCNAYIDAFMKKFGAEILIPTEGQGPTIGFHQHNEQKVFNADELKQQQTEAEQRLQREKAAQELEELRSKHEKTEQLIKEAYERHMKKSTVIRCHGGMDKFFEQPPSTERFTAVAALWALLKTVTGQRPLEDAFEQLFSTTVYVDVSEHLGAKDIALAAMILGLEATKVASDEILDIDDEFLRAEPGEHISLIRK